MFDTFSVEYIEFERYSSNNRDNRITILEKQVAASREENKNLKDEKTTQVTITKKLFCK